MKRVTSPSRVVLVPLLISGFIALPAGATVNYAASGVSAKGVPVSFRAELTISGNLLTVKLFNTSAVPSLNPDDLLSSYFFDIVDSSNNRPALTYVSAFGDVWLTDKSSPDVLQTANKNLVAVNPGDDTWQYEALNPTLNPFAGFGIGTVGNNSLTPNNFHGNVVDGMDYSIYAGDVTTQNLDGRLLVKETATFTFSGVSGFTEADIKPAGGFGLGTQPDSVVFVPEPTTVLLLTLGGLAVFRRRQR